jgi:hypothetical protein
MVGEEDGFTVVESGKKRQLSSYSDDGRGAKQPKTLEMNKSDFRVILTSPGDTLSKINPLKLAAELNKKFGEVSKVNKLRHGDLLIIAKSRDQFNKQLH